MQYAAAALNSPAIDPVLSEEVPDERRLGRTPHRRSDVVAQTQWRARSSPSRPPQFVVHGAHTGDDSGGRHSSVDQLSASRLSNFVVRKGTGCVKRSTISVKNGFIVGAP